MAPSFETSVLAASPKVTAAVGALAPGSWATRHLDSRKYDNLRIVGVQPVRGGIPACSSRRLQEAP
jgi:hypothetical protein